MLKFSSLSQRPRHFLNFTGLKVDEFNKLQQSIRVDWQQIKQNKFKTDRIRKIGGGRKSKLPNLEDRLLVFLIYAKLYSSYLLLEYLFNVDDREMVIPLSKDLIGIFLADAGYISKKLAQAFYQEHRRVLLVKPRANMKKLMTKFEEMLYSTRMLIELNFRNLKMFYGLATSLPRSVDGYLANYIYSLLAYQII